MGHIRRKKNVHIRFCENPSNDKSHRDNHRALWFPRLSLFT